VSADLPLSPARTHDVPPLSHGGWTGFWVVAWAACVALPAATGASALAALRPGLAVLRARVEEGALREQIPPREILDPLDRAADALTGMAAPVLVACLAAAVSGMVLGLAGVGLVRGSEAWRRAARMLLALLVVGAVAGGAWVGSQLLAGFEERTTVLRGAVHDLAVATGEPLGRGWLDAITNRQWVELSVSSVATLVVLPSLVLWFASGRRALRAWCGLKPLGST